MKSAPEILETAAETYRERNKVYGDNFLRVSVALEAMFPQGLTVKTADDWTRLHLFLLSLMKVSRYAVNFQKGGHKDSIHDAMVYCAMLESADESISEKTDDKVM